MHITLNRRLGGLLLAVACAGSLVACQPASSSTDAEVSIWATIGTDAVLAASESRWNARNDDKIMVDNLENDPYKSKLRTAVSAGQGPTAFSSWGGAGLAQYIDADEVMPLDAALEARPGAAERIFPAVLAGATFDGEVYGMPYNGVQPAVIYMNQELFDQVGVDAPQTWDELLAVVEAFNAEGIAPFSIGGASRWPYLMWLAYLTDRLGGPEVFQAIADGEANAWDHPAIHEAVEMIQDLVRAGGFVNGYGAIDANQGAAEALLYTGKAAMQLNGAWAYSATYQLSAAEFIDEGKLSWTMFPEVPGGEGDPSNLTGNLSNYFSVGSKAQTEQQEVATDWLLEEVMSDAYIDDLIASGAVPPVSGIEDKIAGSAAPEWNGFIYQVTAQAENFQLSWDQALDAGTATALLSNLEKVFLLTAGPDEFVTAMSELR